MNLWIVDFYLSLGLRLADSGLGLCVRFRLADSGLDSDLDFDLWIVYSDLPIVDLDLDLDLFVAGLDPSVVITVACLQ